MDTTAVIADPGLGGSEADWIDLHFYPGATKLDTVLSNVGINSGLTKPIVLGEFGAFKSAYGSPSYAGSGMVGLQMQTCAKNFQGWLLWQWDTAEQPEL